jgi:hypothetical protein
MLLNYEYEKKLRVGYIGAGEHSYRNILPCFQYAPIDLVALAEEDTERGLAIARQFGAKRFYPKYQAMLAKEELDAVFIVVPPDDEGHPRYPELATETLKAGFHTWIEAPPCLDHGKEISEYTNACLKSRKYIATGFKKMFAPAYLKVAQIHGGPRLWQGDQLLHALPRRPAPRLSERSGSEGHRSILGVCAALFRARAAVWRSPRGCPICAPV